MVFSDFPLAQLLVQRPPLPVLPPKSVGRGQQTDAAISGPDHGPDIGLGRDFIHRHPMGAHGAHQQFQSLVLGHTGQYIGPAPHLHLWLSPDRCRNLSAAVHHTHPPVQPVRQLADQIPQQRRFAAAGRSHQQHIAGIGAQRVQQRCGTAQMLPRHPQIDRRDILNGGNAAILHHSGTTKAQAVPPFQGQISLAEQILRDGKIDIAVS